ncbi:MAG TPA: CvpA family protein [Pseudogracilibacillus sp.]|nr:CvpA family protein [Pseudogracilibacillus sp.]
MISLLLFLILMFGFLMGLRRGLILQAIHLTSYIISFIVASIYYKKAAEKLSLFIPYASLGEESKWAIFLESMPLENAFYNGIAFVTIFILTKIVLHIIATMLDFVARVPVIKQLNSIGGAILGFFEVYLITFILLFIVALIPIEKVQTIIGNSKLAVFIIEKTPFLTSKIESLWFIENITLL